MNDETNTPVDQPGDEGTPADDGAFKDLLKDIKDGDRQKYTSVEDALASINPAQEHIKTIQEENATLKAELEKAKSIDTLLAKIEEKTAQKTDQSQDTGAFDESKLAELINSTLTAKQQEEKAQANIDTVLNAFRQKYGEKAGDVYNRMAEEAGIGGDTLRDLASKSPTAVLKLAGLDVPKKDEAPAAIPSTHRTENFGSKPVEKSAKINMTGYTSQELVDAWRATKDIVNQ